VNLEIINTGSELMLGRVLNSHQQWLCRQLSDRGYVVARQIAVADSAVEIRQAVSESFARGGLVITTGGLGPTTDDLTRDAIAELLARPLHEDATVLAAIETWFQRRGRPIPPPSVRLQALVPAGAIVLPNAHGTAPGLVLEAGPTAALPEHPPAWLVMLPGPPRELRPMFTEQVLPWLARQFPLDTPFYARTLRTTGIGESMVQERIAGPLAALVAAGLEIGYCARVGEVDVRLASRRPDAMALVAEAEALVRTYVSRHVFGVEDDTLEGAVVRLLTGRRQTLVVAESCTGGRLASRITDVPGASAVFLGGVVSYSNALKQRLLGVRAETLASAGAVSETTAREMAEGARTRNGADYALAVTGIAGPGGGTPAKPVGTVFIALATARATTVIAPLNPYDRETFKNVTTQQALELLRQELLA
jgi:nicotinamide-nucleotide amidase